MALLTLVRPRMCGPFLGCLLTFASADVLIGQTPQSGEKAVKAAFLYNFTKFVDWPQSAFTDSSAPFHVCVFVDPSFRHDVEEMLAGETIGGRPLRVVTPEPSDVKSCHLAYFGPGNADRSAPVLAAMRGVPILTVGEGARFLQQGGVISFVLEDNRVRFDVNKRAVERAGLTVSSKLLRVARNVEDGLR
jgi:uncharacterized protein DUF4154